MRIKQIELNGFKSFMDRTVLELPLGVTAVVGPNGCGKSNIVDAVRWVIGEQSPKHLRGLAMEDVIFAGAGDNGPLGMAEVSMLFERDETDLARAAADAEEPVRSEDGLPPELGHASEVLVTRRYFRSGESEYFINRAPCRLKDIAELFLGTGVGTKAYAIIEQGRVEQLVNAKPEETRLFIEEAAGTTRFRSRKLAAERKMERTRENLVRVQDVLRELERQMSSLERQARRAEEYHRIKDELRGLDLQLMAARQRMWSADVERLGEELTTLHRAEAAVQDDVRRSRGQTADARARRQADAERLRTVEAGLTDERLAAAEAQARAASLAGRRIELLAQADEAEREGERLEARRTALAAELEALAAEASRLADDEHAAERERGAAAERLASLAAAGEPLERAVEEAKDALLDALGEEARVRNMADALHQRRADLQGRRRKLEDEQRQLGERLHQNARGSEAARGAVERIDAERARLAGQRRELAGVQERLALDEHAQAEAVAAACGAETQLRSRADSLRELQVRYEGCTRGVASLLGREETAGALLATVLRVPAHLERAVAAALGARLTQVVVPDTATALSAVAWLRGSAAGSATVVPRDPERRAAIIVPAGRRLVDQIDVDPPHWGLAEALLGQVLLAEDLDQAVELWRAASHAVTVVTPAGEAIDPTGAVTGGSEPPLEETLLARARELRELEQLLVERSAQVAAEERTLARLRERIAETGRAAAVADERLQALRLELVAAEKDRERLEEERVRISAELEVGALEASGLAGEHGQVADELAALDTRRECAGRTATERREQLTACQTALAAWREEHTRAERSHTAAAVRAAAVGERRRAAETELGRCRSGIAEIEERIAGARRHGADAGAGAETAAAEGAAAETARTAAEAGIAALGVEREALLVAIASADTALSADDAAEHAARERLEALRTERSRLDLALAERRIGLEHLGAQLAERYGLGLDALAEVSVEPDADDEAHAARAEALRARLLRLGDVNPAAKEELGELRDRHDFLVTQRADLERSLEDLRRTIGKLTRTSRQRFDETFAAANDKLAEVFPKLFPGGTARLELVPAEEGGEPGVEIVVQPNGKKLQSLSLLSGGEKALTATALILSLFLIRPTPFCLLDEVDAPLDEANIGRFNQLIRDMATASQFVLITHNRRTMEVADTLYGITMEQAGVSKVVAVRLREAA